MSDKRFSIRSATPEDLPALIPMVEALARHHNDTPRATPESLARDLFGPEPWAIALVAEAGAALVAETGASHVADTGGATCVADTGGASLIGYALLVRLYTAHFAARGMELHHLYVAEPARGQGLGRRLAAAAEAHARASHCTYLVVGTHPDNHAAQRLYPTLGFTSAPLAGPRFRKILSEPAG